MGKALVLVMCLAAVTTKAETMVELDRVTAESVEIVAEQLAAQVAAGDRVLWIRINSPGGSVFAGWHLVQVIEEYSKRGTPVVCVVDHEASSMAFVVLQACDLRLMTKRSFLLAHNTSAQAGGMVEDLEETADLMHILNAGIAEFVADRLGITVAKYEARVQPRSWKMGWQAALEVNAIDDTVSPRDLPPVLPAS